MNITEITTKEVNDEIIKKVFFSIPSESNPSADIVVVFGCHHKKLLEERVYQALKLYNENRVSKILLTGGVGFQGDFNESELMGKILIENNVDKNDIIMEDKSRDTIENIINTVVLLKELNLENSKIILLSNQPHFIKIKLLLEQQETSGMTFIYHCPDNDSQSYEKIINNPALKQQAILQIEKIIGNIKEGKLQNFKI